MHFCFPSASIPRPITPVRVRITALLPLLLAAVLVSCGNDDHEPVSNVPPIFTRTGTAWTYDVISDSDIDHTLPSVFEATIRVFPPPPSRNERLEAIWQISYNGRVESTYVYVLGDTLALSPGHSTNLNNVHERYVFPLHTAGRWPGIYCCRDTSRVTGVDTVRVVGGTFTTFKIDRSLTGPNYSLTSTTWINPDVGIIMSTKLGVDLGVGNRLSWYLSAFQPQPAGARLTVTSPEP